MYDVAIIGGGIVGLSVAYELVKSHPEKKIIVIEKEKDVGVHQTGKNSGVIHSGIYYKPGSLKAKNCRYGITLLKKFCSENKIKFEICGKIIIASDKSEVSNLEMIFNRGVENGIKGLEILDSETIREYEPHAVGEAAIFCPETGIVDYSSVCDKLKEIVSEKGKVKTSFEVKDVLVQDSNITLHSGLETIKTKFLINCGGLFSDKILAFSGLKRNFRIVPFRGEYYKLKKEAYYLVKNLIYPVPDPRYPFLGVHFTRTINGEIEAGPNAVLAFSREGYTFANVNFKEMWDYLSYSSFWKMASKYWKTGIKEYQRSLFKTSFLKSLQKLVPDVRSQHIEKGFSGVRAQALDNNGFLLDDFLIEKKKNMIHIINAPSPAATSSLSIGVQIREMYDILNN